MPLDDTSRIADPPYRNIVPQNNQRLPDALTIKHGPARLLSSFLLAADRRAREGGIHLRIRHDFDELALVNRQETAAGRWYPLLDAYNPERTELTPENAFWISGEDDKRDIVVTWAARVHNWVGSNLAAEARSLWYGSQEDQPCVVTAPAAAEISGVVVSGGASWVRPDYRGKHLSQLIPRVGRAYACARWPIDWTFCLIGRPNIDKGLAASYGQRHLSHSVYYPGSPHGEQVLAYTAADEFYEDIASILARWREAADRTAPGAVSASKSLEHIVTKTSFDEVFQGSISRS